MNAPLLAIDNEAISSRQALNYLNTSGKLRLFLEEVARQHVVEKELQAHPDLNLQPQMVSQLVRNFCQQQHIADDAAFQQWLTRNHLNYPAFCQSIVRYWRLQHLKNRITAPQLYEYFIQRKEALNKVHLSCIVVHTKNLAVELLDQLEDGTSFEQLVQQYSIAENRNQNGRMRPISQKELPEPLRNTADVAHPGAVMEPIVLNNNWYLFRFDRLEEISFEAVKEKLQAELFEQWLTNRVTQLTITL